MKKILFLVIGALVLLVGAKRKFPDDQGDFRKVARSGDLDGQVFLQAVRENNKDSVNMYFRHGISANVRVDSKANTALSYRVQLPESYSMIEFLLNNGADPNIKNNDEVTPLYYAINQGDVNVVRLLLERGANPEETVHKHLRQPILFFAEIKGNAEITKLIESYIRAPLAQ